MKINNKNKSAFTPTPTFKSSRKWVSGFSLLEIIIYLAIFSVISVVVINSFIIVLSSYSTIRANHNLLNSGSMAMERISREIRQAKSVDLINSTSQILQLNSTDASSNDVIIKIAKEGGVLNIYKNGILTGNLLAQNIILDSISFDHISTLKSEGEKIKMVLKYTNKKQIRKENFYNTVILRGSFKN